MVIRIYRVLPMAHCMYYTVLDSLHLNGQATLAGNLADLGGLVFGVDTFKQTKQYKEGRTINGLKPMQRYFLGYTLGWLVETRKERRLRQVLSDVHAPVMLRVNGPTSNITGFYRAFDVKSEQSMYRPDSLGAHV